MAEQKIQKKQDRKKTRSCRGKTCYISTDHTEPYGYSYKHNVGAKEECPAPTSQQRAGAVLQAQRVFESFAEPYCEANGYGDDQCDDPCECEPTISNWSSKIKGLKKRNTTCYIEVETSAHIDCLCQT